MSTSKQETSFEYFSDNVIQVEVVAIMELLLTSVELKKDLDKLKMNKEIFTQFSTFKFGSNIIKKKKSNILNIFCKYIHVFVFGYKDLKHVIGDWSHRVGEESLSYSAKATPNKFAYNCGEEKRDGQVEKCRLHLWNRAFGINIFYCNSEEKIISYLYAWITKN